MKSLTLTLSIIILFLASCSSDEDTSSNDDMIITEDVTDIEDADEGDDDDDLEKRYYKSIITREGVNYDFRELYFDNQDRLKTFNSSFNVMEASYIDKDSFPTKIKIFSENDDQEDVLSNDFTVTNVDSKIFLTCRITGEEYEFHHTGTYIDKEIYRYPKNDIERIIDYIRNSENNLIMATEGEFEALYSNFDTEHFRDPLNGEIAETNNFLYKFFNLIESEHSPLTSMIFGYTYNSDLIYDGKYVVGLIEINDNNVEALISHQYE